MKRVDERSRARAALDAHGRSEIFARLWTSSGATAPRPLVPRPLTEDRNGFVSPLPFAAAAGRLGASEASVTVVLAGVAEVAASMDFEPAPLIELLEGDEEAPFDSSEQQMPTDADPPTRLPEDDAPAAAQPAENLASQSEPSDRAVPQQNYRGRWDEERRRRRQDQGDDKRHDESDKRKKRRRANAANAAAAAAAAAAAPNMAPL